MANEEGGEVYVEKCSDKKTKGKGKIDALESLLRSFSP
jgi:hypothetical protein